jgi:4-hydroxy-tetrahydrodipicolinate synthase
MARFGLSVAIATPFASDGQVDVVRLANHAQHLLGRGVESVTVFGTTGEGASIAFAERQRVLDGLTASGVGPGVLIAGVCSSAAGDATAQIFQASDVGVLDFLLTPPFYFKGIGEEALLNWHLAVLDASPTEARFVIYNIPQLTAVPVSPDLLGRLCDRYPGRIRAVKDSSGSWESADAFLRAGHAGVLVGDERLLPRAIREGAAGAISGMANLHPEAMRRIVDYGSDEPALISEVNAVVAEPVIAAIKCLLAQDLGDPAWEAMRPPLAALGVESKSRLLAAALAARAV